MLTKNDPKKVEAGRLIFRAPRASDGPQMYALIDRCKPLDLNSRYCYLILCEHFFSTCVVVERDENIIGLITAYRRPDQPETLFIWQVAVDQSMRGQGLAKRMMQHLFAQPSLADITAIEATVNPSNHASRALFHSMAATVDARVDETPLFAASIFGAGDHEQENLIRVHPLSLDPSGK
ncbi:MAG: diaminobutyrate acetyltransferase [Zetaproteobacteria bacterium]|nr:diaminobutyrate acetyltransferase [Zetaproteobacteria bacterium]